MTSPRHFFVLGSLGGFLSVALGAFGAHALKQTLSPELLATFETGVRYQLYHSLALLAAGWGWSAYGRNEFHLAGWCFTVGILFFSGSLYALALSGIRALGMITPFGGVAFLIGWLLLAVGFWKAPR